MVHGNLMKFFLFHGPGVIFHILHESVWRETGGISAIVSLEDNQLPLFADKIHSWEE